MRRRGDPELGFIGFGTGVADEVEEDQQEAKDTATPEKDFTAGAQPGSPALRLSFVGRVMDAFPEINGLEEGAG